MTRIYISIILTGLLLAALCGCGSSGSGAPYYLGNQHPAGWSAGTYHGIQALDLAKREQCTECHGKDLKGGTSKVSCYTCHSTFPHPEGWADGATQHGPQYVANPDQCKKCHGQDLKGGISNVSCFSATFNGLTCHASGPPSGHPAGWASPTQHGAAAKAAPGAATGYAYCSTCHVNFKDAPGTSCFACHTTSPHPSPWINGAYTHTTTNTGNAPQCARCHLNGQYLTTPITVPAGVTPGCFNNTLCHGPMGGAPHAYPYPGSAHNSTAAPFTGCTGCHAMGSAASPYPVAAGTKPDCMACHIKSQPVGNPARCESCHGTSANGGQPVGSAFPDRAGEHALHLALGITCATCHPNGGTGSPNHGNSGGVKRNPANVSVTLPSGIIFTSTATTTTGGGTCAGTCHGQSHSNAGNIW